jgi:uncharacterized protein
MRSSAKILRTITKLPLPVNEHPFAPRGLTTAGSGGIVPVRHRETDTMPPTVFHASMRANLRRNMLDKVDLLLDHLGLPKTLGPQHLVAVKCHFGEHGNTAFLRPVYVRHVVEAIKKTGARVFVTDTNTLYRGSRADAVAHLETAAYNGFTHHTLGAPLVIADGLRARSAEAVAISGAYFDSVPIAEAIVRADAMVVLSHFKLHEATGFGGAIKNLGMGCAAREGKLAMHSAVSPRVDPAKCTGDAICVRACTFNAIRLVDGVAVIDEDICTGCAECLGACPHGAIAPRFNQELLRLAEYMAEYAQGAVADKPGGTYFLNFMTAISPACDCYPMADAPIIADQGIFASLDPVAIDQACLDALQNAPGLPGTALKTALNPGDDKIADIYPKLPYRAQLEHGERIGLGKRDYELTSLD